MKKRIAFFLILAAVGVCAWCFRANIREHFEPKRQELVLCGNVDDRQLNLSFLISERIAALLPEEGTLVRKGELLGELETIRLANDIASSRAEIAARNAAFQAAQALYEKAKNGSRPEDIAIARAGNAAIEAKIKAAESDYKRKTGSVLSGAVSLQSKEDAESQYLFLKAGLQAVENYLNRLLAGERKEDIAAASAACDQARAELRRAEAELAIREQRLKDAKLYAPCDGIVRNRLLEPGELASPQAPVLTLAVVSPKWIRAYLPETKLLAVQAGERAIVHFDGAGKPFEGWVGFISPTAEFTPKNIETAELRPSLLYEVRVFVKDPDNLLKLGAPATVTFPGR